MYAYECVRACAYNIVCVLVVVSESVIVLMELSMYMSACVHCMCVLT